MKSLCQTVDSRGKLVADAQHEVVCAEHGCTRVTCDTDFELVRAGGLRLEVSYAMNGGSEDESLKALIGRYRPARNRIAPTALT